MNFGSDVFFYDCLFMSFSECEALGFKACREINGPFVDYLQREFNKPLLLSGLLIPDAPSSPLDPNGLIF